MEERSIRIELAGRAYPITIASSEEENLRKAADEINGSLARLREAYPHTDKQDLLAMAALEVTTRALNNSATRLEAGAEDVLAEVEKLLSDPR